MNEETPIWVRFVAPMDGYEIGDVARGLRLFDLIGNPSLGDKLLVRFPDAPRFLGYRSTTHCPTRFAIDSDGKRRFYELSEMEFLASVASGKIEIDV